MNTGFRCLRANSTVFFEPPVNTAGMENTTVPSESRTFIRALDLVVARRLLQLVGGGNFAVLGLAALHQPPWARGARWPSPGRRDPRRSGRRRQALESRTRRWFTLTSRQASKANAVAVQGRAKYSLPTMGGDLIFYQFSRSKAERGDLVTF